jgi:hypothetical protein
MAKITEKLQEISLITIVFILYLQNNFINLLNSLKTDK